MEVVLAMPEGPGDGEPQALDAASFGLRGLHYECGAALQSEELGDRPGMADKYH
jgi:hypothetical protein